MSPDSLAASLDFYRSDAKSALRAAAQDGFRVVEANALVGDLRPGELSESGRRHLRKILADLGLRLGGLTLDFPGRGLGDPTEGDRRFSELDAALELAADLRIPRVCAALACSGAPDEVALGQTALAQAAAQSDRYGVHVAIQAPEAASGFVLSEVSRLACPTLGLSLDSASADAAKLSQLRQALRVRLRDVVRRGEAIEESDWGRGQVDFGRLLAELEATGFQRDLVLKVDRRLGVDALRRGRDYMARLLDRRL